MPYGRLEVTVVEGKQLKETDIFDKANPYVSLSVDKQNKRKTRTAKNAGSDATWNENFIFDVLEGRNELFLEVLDADIDELIGGVVIPLYQVFYQGHSDQWVNIARPSGKLAGEIHLFMNFENQGPTSGPPGHTPYPVPGGSGYFSPPNSGSSTYKEFQIQQDVFSNLGPEGGAIPLNYGSGAPPLIKPPEKMILNNLGSEGGTTSSSYGSGTPPPTESPHSTAGDGFHDSSSYSMNMPGQVEEKEQKLGDDSDLMTISEIGLAAADMGDKFNNVHKCEDRTEE